MLCRETEPNWDQDIATDVKEECEKYGPVDHIYVDRNSQVRGEGAQGRSTQQPHTAVAADAHSEGLVVGPPAAYAYLISGMSRREMPL